MNVSGFLIGFGVGFLCGWILFLMLTILRDFDHEEEG